jgi:hypothetical protein
VTQRPPFEDIDSATTIARRMGRALQPVERRLLRAIARNTTPIVTVSLNGAVGVSAEFVHAVHSVCAANEVLVQARIEELRATRSRDDAETNVALIRGLSYAYLKRHGDGRRTIDKEEFSDRTRLGLAFKFVKRAAIKREIRQEVIDRVKRNTRTIGLAERRARGSIEAAAAAARLTLVAGTFEVRLRGAIEREEQQAGRVLWLDHCEGYRAATITIKHRQAGYRAQKALMEADERRARGALVGERWAFLQGLLAEAQSVEEKLRKAVTEARIRQEDERRRAVAAAADAANIAERVREAAQHQTTTRNDRLGRTIAMFDRDLTRLVRVLEAGNLNSLNAFTALRGQHEAFVLKVNRLNSLHRQLASLFSEAPSVAIAASGHSPISAVFQPTAVDAAPTAAISEWVPVEPTLVVQLDMDRLWLVRVGIVTKELQRLLHGVRGAIIDLQDESAPHLQVVETSRRSMLQSAPKVGVAPKEDPLAASPRGGGAAPAKLKRTATVVLQSLPSTDPLSGDDGVPAKGVDEPVHAPDLLSPGSQIFRRESTALRQYKRHLKHPVDLTAVTLDVARCSDGASIESLRHRKLTFMAGIVTARLSPDAAKHCALRYAGDWDTVDVDGDNRATKYYPSPVRKQQSTSICGGSFDVSQPRDEPAGIIVRGRESIRLDVPAGASGEDLERELRKFSVSIVNRVDEAAIGEIELHLDLRALKARSYLGRTHSKLARFSVKMPCGAPVECRTGLQFLIAPPLLTLRSVGFDATVAGSDDNLEVRHDGRQGPLPLLPGLQARDPPAVSRVSTNSTTLRLATAEDLAATRTLARLPSNVGRTPECVEDDADGDSDDSEPLLLAQTIAGRPEPLTTSPCAVSEDTYVRAGAFRGLHVVITPLVFDAKEDTIVLLPPAGSHPFGAVHGAGEERNPFAAFTEPEPTSSTILLERKPTFHSSNGEPTIAFAADGRDVYVEGMLVATMTRPRRGVLELRFTSDLALDGATHVAPVLNALHYRNTSFDPTTGRRAYRITASSSGGVTIDAIKCIDLYVIDKPTRIIVSTPEVVYPALVDAACDVSLLSKANAEDVFAVEGRDGIYDVLRRRVPVALDAVLEDPAKTFFDGGSLTATLLPAATSAVPVGEAVALTLDAQVVEKALPAGLSLVPRMRKCSGLGGSTSSYADIPFAPVDADDAAVQRVLEATIGRRSGYVARGGGTDHLSMSLHTGTPLVSTPVSQPDLQLTLHHDGEEVGTVTVKTNAPANMTERESGTAAARWEDVLRYCTEMRVDFVRGGTATLDAAELFVRSLELSVPPRLLVPSEEPQPAGRMIHAGTVRITVSLGPSWGRKDINGNDIAPSCDEQPAMVELPVYQIPSHVIHDPTLSLPSEDDTSAAQELIYEENSGAVCPFLGFESIADPGARATATRLRVTSALGGNGFIVASIVAGADESDLHRHHRPCGRRYPQARTFENHRVAAAFRAVSQHPRAVPQTRAYDPSPQR